MYDIVEKQMMASTFLKVFLSRLIIENPDFEITPFFALTWHDFPSFWHVISLLEELSVAFLQ